MVELTYSKARVHAFLDEITKLKAADFPYPHGKAALEEIEKVFVDLLHGLDELDDESDAATVRAACAAEVSGLFDYLPLLGFILRSTNTRNAFETYKPFLRLSRQIVGPDTRLLLSSEWEYSPLTYFPITHLPNYVLIGFPAHESGNPLLIPLGGHELGHTIWNVRNLASTYNSRIEEIIVAEITGPKWDTFQKMHPEVEKKEAVGDDLIARQLWISASDWAMRQTEETFCDMVGLRIFGEGYLYAFAYLLSPRPLGSNSGLYPKFRRRVDDLINASANFHVTVSKEQFSNCFDYSEEPYNDSETDFLLNLADLAAGGLTERTAQDADRIVSDAGVAAGSSEKVNEIYRDLELIAPAHHAGALSNILNAGWKAYHDEHLWTDMPHVSSKMATLKELLLKAIEVFEYEEILKSP